MKQVLTDGQIFSLLEVLEEGDKSFTQKSYRDLIMTAHTDMLFELGVRDVATMEFGWKAFGKLQTKFKSEVLSIYGKFRAGTLSTAAATTKFNGLLKTYGKDAFMAGTQMVGNSYYKEVGMTVKDKAFINKYARAETRHWRKFLGDIKDPKHLPVNKIPRDAKGRLMPGYRRQVHSYNQRAGYYGDSLRAMPFNGMVAGAGTLLNIFWVLDKLAGRKADHCSVCMRIAGGNPYSWQTLPTTPRAGDTECLYRCYCGLEIQQKKGRGREFDAPGSGSTQALHAPNRWARIFDRFGRPVGGAPLRDIEDIYQRMYKARQMIEITRGQEKLKWIRMRQQLNSALINQYPQYRKVPMVSVKDLIKAVKIAQPEGKVPLITVASSEPIKSFVGLSNGTQITLLRGDYFANGKLFLRKGQWIFKDATGVELVANLETDVMFLVHKKAVVDYGNYFTNQKDIDNFIRLCDQSGSPFPFKVISSNEMIERAGVNAFAVFDPNDNTVCLNGEFWNGNLSKADNTMKSMISRHMFSQRIKDRLQYALQHEIGHGKSNLVMHLEVGEWLPKTAKQLKAVDDYWYSNRMGWDRDYVIIQEIGRNATVNRTELLADVYAMWKTGLPLSKEMEKLVKAMGWK